MGSHWLHLESRARSGWKNTESPDPATFMKSGGGAKISLNIERRLKLRVQ